MSRLGTAYRYQDPGDHIPERSVRVRPSAVSDPDLLVQVLERLPAPPRRVVDVGGGEGRLLPVLAARAEEVVLVEPDATRLARAERRAAERALTNAAFAGQDARSFAEAATTRFDLVVCSHVIQHVSRRQRAPLLAALRRLLADEGHALVTFPATDRARSRYLVSQRAPGSATVSTTAVTARRFDRVAEARPTDEPSPGLPVWHAPPHLVARGLERAGLHAHTVIPYRPFDFALHHPPGVSRPAFAVDTALLAAPS